MKNKLSASGNPMKTFEKFKVLNKKKSNLFGLPLLKFYRSTYLSPVFPNSTVPFIIKMISDLFGCPITSGILVVTVTDLC